MDSSSKYLEQFNRVKRWYQRLATIDEGRQHNLPSNNYQDEVYAFFVNCFHLKDWIENDESVGSAAKDKVEDFVKNNGELNLCRDICHGIKHLKLKHPRSGQGPRFGQRNFHLQMDGSGTTISVKYTIDTLSGPVDAFKLATKCLEAWENFILLNIKVEQK